MSAFHVEVPRNPNGRDFVIGDLHGHLSALHQALGQQRFNSARDRLFSVGDLIDRGPDSPGCAALIREPWFHAVRGNHEDMLLRALGAGDPDIIGIWRQNGGDWGLDDAVPNAAARAAATLCARLPHAITLHHRSGRRFGICHAQSPVSDWAQIEQAGASPEQRRDMLWSRERIRRRDAAPVAGIDWTIHGHTLVDAPLRSANALFIETGIYRPGGHLTLLCLDDI